MLRFPTAGESHGKSLTTIIEGIPAGLPITEEYIEKDMARRQIGYGRGGRMQIEKDRAEILSGVRHGLTLGSPIALLVINRDWSTGKGPDGVPWTDEMDVSPSEVPFETITHIRPGHADTPGVVKYMQSDARNILERSSAREFASRVAAGATATATPTTPLTLSWTSIRSTPPPSPTGMATTTFRPQESGWSSRAISRGASQDARRGPWPESRGSTLTTQQRTCAERRIYDTLSEAARGFAQGTDGARDRV